MTNPPFNDARGAATLTSGPPFDFSGVVMRTFPLKANMWVLRKLCQQYLNVAPPEFVEFEPAMPFVFLQVLNYGQMTSDVANAGWVSQHEVAFGVPLLQYRRENGHRVPVSTASVSPFIFVDQASSQATGRQVFGWPKVMGWLEPGTSSWARNPKAPLNLFILKSVVSSDDGPPAPRRLVEIRHRPTPTIADVPPEWDDPLNPFATIPRIVRSSLSLSASMLEMFTALPILGYDPDAQSLQQSIGMFAEQAASLENPSFNTVNLKQFRDAAHPGNACFQALTTASMTIRRFNRGGLLGEAHQLQGSIDGGFEVRISRYTSQPLIEALGLEVAREQVEPDETSIAVLKPICPFWLDVDFRYGRGAEICWRSSRHSWQIGSPKGEPESPPPDPPAYNIARGAAVESFAGPFSFPDATVRVLPLLANPHRLQYFVNRYLNSQGGAPGEELPRQVRFEAWGRYVYLMIASHSVAALGYENRRLGQERVASFCVPIKWFQGDYLFSTGILRAYVYSDNETGVITTQEVQGWPAEAATLGSPEDPWMQSGGPEVKARKLLELRADVLQALGMGEELQRRLLLEVGTEPIFRPGAGHASEAAAANWGEALVGELNRLEEQRREQSGELEAALALALQPLVFGSSVNDIALRQFRDVHEPDRACYQAVSLSRAVLKQLTELQEIEELVHVGVHRYATAPIVETLGLEVKASEETDSGLIDWLQPLRPFWMRADIKTQLGQDIFYRVHDQTWYQAPLPLGPSGQRVGVQLTKFIDLDPSRKRHLSEAQHWDGKRMSLEEAVAALSAIEPQLIISALLSRDWGNQGAPRWRNRKRDAQGLSGPDVCVPAASLGPFGGRFQKLHPELKTLQDSWYLEAPSRTDEGKN